ncbi:MAG: PadR family transcriptional regulator [Micrococcaceae bacterium]
MDMFKTAQSSQATNDVLRGHTDAIILNILRSRDQYGYEIAKQIYERSRHQYEIKEPTMYSCLKRLEKNGYVTSYWGDESEGGRRKYYKISNTGKLMLEEHLNDWEKAQKILKDLLKETHGK